MDGLDVPKIDVDQKELAALEQAATVVMDQAQRVASAIVDVDSCKQAQVWCAERLTFAKHLRKKSWLAGIRDTWHKQHKSVCEIIVRYALPHEVAVRKVVDPAITIFLNGQEEKRRAEEKRLQDEARKRDENERLRRAEQLSKDGKSQQAEHVLDTPGSFIAPKLDPINLPGMSQRKTWKVKPIEGDDLIALIKAIAGGAVPLQAIAVNYSFLNKQAQLLDGNLKYPGVECYQEQTNAHRRIA